MRKVSTAVLLKSGIDKAPKPMDKTIRLEVKKNVDPKNERLK